MLLLVMLGGCTMSSPQPSSSGTDALTTPKPRVVVTTHPELDDSNSLIRYLLYSTDFRTEGLVYASSQFHWKGDGEGTAWFVLGREYTRFGVNLCPCESWRWAPDERFIDDAVDIYERVYTNLRVHDPAYPTPTELRSKIRWGNVAFDGDISEDTPGSDLIRDLLLDEDPEPIYLLAWGGASTIARALKSIQDQYEGAPEWPSIQRKVSRKAIIQAFLDQDDTYATYIQPEWPQVAFRDMAAQTYGYGARGAVLPQDQVYLSAAWLSENVSNRSPLGAHYRVWGDGKQMVEGDIFDYFGFSGLTGDELKAKGYVVWMPVQEPGSWISEGDTHTFLNLLDNGLRAAEEPTYGGWSGREGIDNGQDGPDPHYAAARFFGVAQRDFAARMAWSVTPTYDAANHAPEVAVRGPRDVSARPSETVRLEGTARDPDGDAVTVKWWQYTEAGTYPGQVTLAAPTAPTTSFRVPDDAIPGSTIHLILEATDNGQPALTRYQRVIVSVGS